MSVQLTMPQLHNTLKAGIIENMEVAERGGRPEDYTQFHIEGSKGIGKTDTVRAVTRELGADEGFMKWVRGIFKDQFAVDAFLCRTTILMQYESTDIAGVPWVTTTDDGSAEMVRARPVHMPMVGAGVWFMDEASKVQDQSMINVMSQCWLERRLGEFRVSPGYSIISAGNLRSEKTGDRSFPPHIWDRLCRLEAINPANTWMDWALANGVDPTVVFFVKQYPMHYNTMVGEQVKNATPRGLVQAGKHISGGHYKDVALQAVLVGDIGESAGIQLYNFHRIKDDLPDPDMVLAKPDDVKLPDSTEALYVMMAGVSGRVDRQKTPGFLKIMERVDNERKERGGREITTFSLQAAYKRDASILTGAHGEKLAARYRDIVQLDMSQ